MKIDNINIEGNIVYGGENDTVKLLEKIAEAIINGGILIDDVRITKTSKNSWRKVSFWYKFGSEMTDRDKEIEKLSKNDITELTMSKDIGIKEETAYGITVEDFMLNCKRFNKAWNDFLTQ